MRDQQQFNLVKEELQKKGFQCIGPDETTPHLEVILRTDAAQRLWKVFLYATSQKLSYGEKEGKEAFLQLFLPFPFVSAPENVQSLARLLLLINKSFPFPAFGLSETDGVIYYRHLLYCKNKTIPEKLVCSIIETLLLYVDSLSPMIEMISSGEKQLYEALEEALKL